MNIVFCVSTAVTMAAYFRPPARFMEEPKVLATYVLGERRDIVLIVKKTVFTLRSQSLVEVHGVCVLHLGRLHLGWRLDQQCYQRFPEESSKCRQQCYINLEGDWRGRGLRFVCDSPYEFNPDFHGECISLREDEFSHMWMLIPEIERLRKAPFYPPAIGGRGFRTLGLSHFHAFCCLA